MFNRGYTVFVIKNTGVPTKTKTNPYFLKKHFHFYIGHHVGISKKAIKLKPVAVIKG